MSRANLLRSALILITATLAACASTGRAEAPAVQLAAAVPAGAPSPAAFAGGWADVDGPTLGGATADAAHTFLIKTRAELLSALENASSQPKILYIDGMIDLCATDDGRSLSGMDFILSAGLDSQFASYEAYQQAYIAGCSASALSSLESVRNLLNARQKTIVQIRVGSNTSILGIGATSGFKNGSLVIQDATNVVVRNLVLQDAYDYFPSWDPKDGNINSEYDNLVITNSTRVWVDHCTLSDGARPDSLLPTFEIRGVGNQKKWVTHDGLLDIVKGSQYVTVSWCVLENHDKSFLIGSSDSATGDRDKLQVTIHHNLFRALGQRMPRARFGQIHLYNNVYEDPKSYAIGVGDNCRIWSEANWFPRPIISITAFDDRANEGYIWDVGSFNINPDRLDSAALVGWKPSKHYLYKADKPEKARESVLATAGAGKF